jgi:hypothetical protein
MAKDVERPLNKQVALRVSEDEAQRLDAFAARFPILSKHAVARFALKLGLDLLERDPSLLLSGGAPTVRRGRPRKKP